VNAAFLLVTTWITGAGQAPATTVAPPSMAGAPLTSVPLTSAPLTSAPITAAPGGPMGSCCGGGGGYGAAAACGDCGSCCEMSCGGGHGFFGRFRGGRHKGGGDCGCCDGGYAPVMDGCDTCGSGGGGFFGRFRGGHKGGYDCGCDCGVVSDGGCCSSSGGLFGRFRHHKRGGDCGCGGDIGCDGCDGCGSPGFGGASAPLSHAPYGAVQPYGTGLTPYGTPGTMPPAGEPIKLPKDATTPSKKLPSGGTSRQVAPPPLEAAPSTSKTNETETKSPFELDRRYETRVERAADYSWLTGQLFYVHADGGLWVLRYAPLWKEDPNGGSVVLARDRQMDSYREGDLVTVHGEILSSKGSPYLGGPLYRAQSIQLVDRPQR
jgi:hypothetical protein